MSVPPSETGRIVDNEPGPGKYAIGLPGQGGTLVEAGLHEYKTSSSAEEVFETAERIVAEEIPGFSVKDLVFNGPQQALETTLNNHIANTAIYLAKYHALKEERPDAPEPDVIMPVSMGECAALEISGVLSQEDTFKVAVRRGMATEKGGKEFPGCMASILNLRGGSSQLLEVCRVVREEKGGVVDVSNINSENELVISGEVALVEEVMSRLGKDARKMFKLPISFASHCALMENASQEFAQAIEDMEFKDPKIPWVMNGEVVTTGDEIKRRMIEGLKTMVNVKGSLQKLQELGIAGLIEMSPKPVTDEVKSTFERYAKTASPELQVLLR